MNTFFRKENMLNTIFFSALFIMVVVKTIVNSESIKEITFVISILLLVWSIISIVISVLEEINDVLTEELTHIEKRYTIDDLDKMYSEKIIKQYKREGVFCILQKCSENEIDDFHFCDDYDKRRITKYWQFAKKRRKIRELRKIFVFILCVVLVIILAYLFLVNEINKYLPIANYDLTIWSLIIVFFEFTIKKPFTEAVVNKVITIRIKNQ